MQDFHQLSVWRKAHGLVLHVYKATNQLPASENLGLAGNLRRSAVTIPRAIAEGAGRDSSRDFALDLGKARAAAYELEYICFSAATWVSSRSLFTTNCLAS